jgi:RNA polymerase sigma factor (sigma-70 family)
LLEDENIIQGCRENDRRSQQELFLKYGQKMYGFCLRYSQGPDDANDLLQDGFIKVFENIKSYKGDSPLQAWMSRVFINLAITRFRKKSGGPRFVDVEEADIVDDNDDAPQVASHDMNKVMQCMAELPEKYRLVINLYAIDKMGHKEIAEQLGISEGTSKSQLSRARQMLKDLLERN